jgi:flagellin
LIQTLDGATDEITNMMQRMRELAVQSMNGTYTAANRTQMNAEFTQLSSEIQRVAETTKFNGTALINGSTAEVAFQVGWETAAADKVTVTLDDLAASAAGLNLSAQSINAATAASDAIAILDTGMGTVNTNRANWGALQNRLESTVSNLQNVSENISAAKSRIADADFAKESANLARTQVLQAAGMSMLSQANQQSENVLSLLR